MAGRTLIWKAGLQAFPEHPILGAGAGAYEAAVEPYLRFKKRIFSHNVALALLVEEGVVGALVFAVIVGACARTIYHLPPPHRALWTVLILAWLVGSMSGNWEHAKVTWVLFGLIAAQSGAQVARRQRHGAALRVPSFDLSRETCIARH
jgi:O-antigen ligase